MDHFECLSLVRWVAGLFVGCLIDRVAGWLVGWFCIEGWLIDGFDWLTDRLGCGRIIGWFVRSLVS